MKYQKTADNKVKCLICPRECLLSENQRGYCYVRKNVNSNVICETYGYNTGLAIDPIEKKPLYHFYPGSQVLSFGTFGCNMGCLFCQNYHMSKAKFPVTLCDKNTPENIVTAAKLNNCKSIAFTYNDPTVFFEYAIDTAKSAKENDVKTVAVTAGYMNIEPAKEFFSYMDAANIDLKGFSENFYKKNCLAHLKPVLDVINYVANDTNCHLELTTLLIDGENDKYIEDECKWIIDNIGDSIPIHFSAFYPRYKFSDKNQTNINTLINAYNIAKNIGIKHVYTGNITDEKTSTTYCKKCNSPLIKRVGYLITENNVINGKCKYCGEECDGKF